VLVTEQEVSFNCCLWLQQHNINKSRTQLTASHDSNQPPARDATTLHPDIKLQPSAEQVGRHQPNDTEQVKVQAD